MYNIKADLTNLESVPTLGGSTFTYDFTAYSNSNDVIEAGSSTGNTIFVPTENLSEASKYIFNKHIGELSDNARGILINEEED